MIKKTKSVTCVLFLSLLLSSSGVKAQSSLKDSSISMVMIRPSYGIQVPGGDLANRFGVNQSIGIGVSYKTRKGLVFSAEGSFIFGNTIKEQGLFTGLTTSEGTIIGVDGLYGDIRTTERGYYVTLGLGKVFKVAKPNPNCGFIIEGSAGFIQHKIKIQDKKNSVPALREEYVKGYDRLVNGLVIREFIGYLYVGNRRLVNFYGGFEAVQGFTAGRRDYIFPQMIPGNESRIDLLFGFRLGWVIPLFKEAPEEFYLY